MDRIIRKPELLQITGVSSATVYRWIGEKSFPAPVRLGPNSTGWRESEVEEWLESRQPVQGVAATAPSDSDDDHHIGGEER
jgi:prophage regulatory protein